MDIWNRVRRWLPHIAIVIAGMYIVLYFIDKVNAAMNFVNNGITKTLLLIVMIIMIYLCTRVIHYDRAVERARRRKELQRRKSNAGRGTRV